MIQLFELGTMLYGSNLMDARNTLDIFLVRDAEKKEKEEERENNWNKTF